MNDVIYCFSGTGNSLYVAERMAGAIEGATIEPIADKPATALGERGTIGFVFPTYFGGLPKPVSRFLALSDFSAAREAYVYACITCGGSILQTAALLSRELRKTGASLSYYAQIAFPTNYILWHEPAKDKERRYAEAEDATDAAIAAVTASQEVHARSPVPGFRFLQGLFANRRADGDYYVAASCNGCGTCAKVCPVANIRLQEGKPVWLGKCVQCLGCLHYCPKGAIEAQKSAGKPRITNPHISAPHISQFHARGRG